MRTVHEVSELAHVSVRTLHHYDKTGLLRPSARSEAGYRLYSDKDLARLQEIMLFRELEFSLADIGAVLDSPDFDLKRALDQQIELLELRREHIGNLIDMARAMRDGGEGALEFGPFDTSKLDEYSEQAKASWGKTPQWKEYEEKWAGRSKGEQVAMGRSGALRAVWADVRRRRRPLVRGGAGSGRKDPGIHHRELLRLH